MAIYVADAHLTSAQLFTRKQEAVHTIFPETIGPRLSGIYVATSVGKGTLLLSGEKVTSLGHCCDELREICPVGVEVSNYACGQEVLDAIEAHGESLEECPKIVALSVEYVPGNGADTQKELAELISGLRSEVVMGEFRLECLSNSWQNTPDGGKGLAYEQSDQIIRTWLHEKNPKSGETAKQSLKNLINATEKAEEAQMKKACDLRAKGKMQFDVEKQILNQLAEIRALKKGYQYQLETFDAEHVNSFAHTTLQCSIVMQIEGEKEFNVLRRYASQGLVSVIDRAVRSVDWDVLKIEAQVITNLMREKFNALKTKMEVLIENGVGSTDWRELNSRMDKQEKLIMKEKKDFLQYGEACVEQNWAEHLKQQFIWVSDNLKLAIDDLKRAGYTNDVVNDTSGFAGHKEKMYKVLRSGDRSQYALGLELKEWDDQLKLLDDAKAKGLPIVLSKRLTTTGNIRYGLTKAPSDPTIRPDPCGRHNDVHLPV